MFILYNMNERVNDVASLQTILHAQRLNVQ